VYKFEIFLIPLHRNFEIYIDSNLLFFMQIINKKRHIILILICAFTALSAAAQDLLARQAPIDRRMKVADTVSVPDYIIDNDDNLAKELYQDWDNRYAHRASELPDSFTINLRHFCMPTKSRVVTSNFGARWGRMHKGLDIKVYIGDTIRAAFSGKVRIVRYEARGYGKYIVIRHPNGLETIYGHLSQQLVTENQEVRAGEVIGLGGNTGRSTGSHLHFETRLCGVALNPALMFDFRNQDVTGDTYAFKKRSYDRESADATRLRGKIGNGGYTRDMVQGNSMPKTSSDDLNMSNEPRYHKVKSGETLYSIARTRGVNVDQLYKLNHLSKGTKVRVGQIIRYS